MGSENKFIKHSDIWESVQAIINNECKELNTLDHLLRRKGWNTVAHSFLSPLGFLKTYIYIPVTVSGIPLSAKFILKLTARGTRTARLK